MTGPVFERLAVIGLGLLGGSVALGARERGLAGEVRGVDPALDSAGPIRLTPLASAASWADGIVLAAPLDQFPALLAKLSAHVAPDCIITDTASLKVPVAEAARRLLAAPERCVGAHPMAGGDASGFAHARADLFEGEACILALSGAEPAPVVDRVEQFWQGLGTLTARRTPEEHDALVAVLSHAPHAIAFAFAAGLPRGEALELAGPGLRDFLRIARANPRLWSDILLMNRSRVAEEISRFEKQLGSILDALARQDRDALERVLGTGRDALEHLDR